MELCMRMLAEKLGPFHPETHFSWDDRPLLKNIKFIYQDKNADNPEFAYLAKAEDLPETLSGREGLGIICIGRSILAESLCRKASNNIILLDADCDPFAVFDALQDCFQFFNQWEKDLQACAVSGNGLQELIDLGGRVFGNPLFLLDSALMALAWSKDICADSIIDNWRSIAVEGHANAEFIKSTKDSELLNYHNSLIEPTFVLSPRRAILHNIRASSVTVARICVEEVNTALNESHLHLLKHFSKYILTVIQRDLSFQKTQGSIYDFFIIEQLEGKMHDEQLIRGYLRFQGWKMSDSFCVIVVQDSDPDNAGNTLEYHGNLLKGMFFGSRSYIYEQRIVLIINENKIKFSSADSNNPLKEFLRSNNLKGGVSASFQNFSNLHDHFRQADTALRLGAAFSEKQSLYCYKDHAVYHIIENCSKSMNLRLLCHPAVMKLYEYDMEFHSDYFNSLSVYLIENKNLSDTARILGIHRNTAAYRMNKIASLTDLDLEDESHTPYLFLSCKIIEYLRIFPSEERRAT